PLMAGIQALMDQGIAVRGLPADQGNAAPTLYALAGREYGNGNGAAPASLAQCNSDNGTNGTANCVFHNVTRGAISSNCLQVENLITTPDCYYYGSFTIGSYVYDAGVTSLSSTVYNAQTKAYSTR